MYGFLIYVSCRVCCFTLGSTYPFNWPLQMFGSTEMMSGEKDSGIPLIQSHMKVAVSEKKAAPVAASAWTTFGFPL